MSAANVAVTERARAITTTQLPAPEHAPDQPVNFHPGAGEAVNVTVEPSTNDATQSPGHTIPPGEETTDPDPTTDTDS